MKLRQTLVLCLFLVSSVAGQNLAPNPSFENGTSAPTNWSLSFFSGLWETNGRTGSRSVSITAPSWSVTRWTTYECPIQAGKVYTVSFWSRASNAVSGHCTGTFDGIFRNFFPPPTNWANYAFAGYIPSNSASTFSVGQTSLGGPIYFDDVEVYEAIPVHKIVANGALGAGESFKSGRYNFETRPSSYAANYDRCLFSANARFSSDRWLMYGTNELVYHHGFDGLIFTNVQLRAGIWNQYGLAGVTAIVDVSTNGVDWQNISQLQGASALTSSVPVNLLPTSQLWVRLRSTNSGQFSLTSYSLQAAFAEAPADATGQTYLLGSVLANSPVQPIGVFDTTAGEMIRLAVPNQTAASQTFEITSRAEYLDDVREWRSSAEVPSGATNLVDVRVPTAGFGHNLNLIELRDTNGAAFAHYSFRSQVSILTDDSYGQTLPSPTNCSAWWCGGSYKVGRNRAVPLATNQTVNLSAARNEYEPFQLVLRPQVALTNATVSIGDFVGVTNVLAAISATNISICQVEYVPVTQLYLSVQQDFNAPNSSTGETPDPLVPLTGALDVPAGVNTPLWFTVHVPRDAAPGVYEANITVQSTALTFSVPVRLLVRSFGLSDATHTDQAINLVIEHLWHKPTNDLQSAELWDLYLQNMQRHRISPFMPNYFAQINWAYNATSQSFTHNFTAFDTAMERYLEDFRFTSFKDINEPRALPDIPGVTKFNASNTGIHPSYRPLYVKLMQPVVQHFREQGWLDRAYSFWIDEPPVDNSQAVIDKVKDGMRMVEEAAPDLSRLLSGNAYNTPHPQLYGDVDIWVPGFYAFTYKPDRNQQRQAAGDKIWPYCFVYPHPPWPNNLIDHPGVSPRIRHWMHEKLNTDGEISWGINYYFVTAAGPRNPWTTPMCTYFNGEPLGNGDGSLVYPPTKTPPVGPYIAGPFDSTRWEMIREGIEDREYFWLLDEHLARAAAQLGTNHPNVLLAQTVRSNALAGIPWPPVYPYEPEDLQAARDRIADAIELLDTGAPLVAEQPLSKTAPAGATRRIQAEFLGWPMPGIQWQLNGTNLPGATSWRLTLTNLTLDMAGDYRAIASNTAGSITSAVSRVNVLVTNQPPIILAHPASLSRTNGERAVFGVGASSLTPIAYQWFFGAVPITDATNVTLLLTNLSVSQAGEYSVLASNAYGTALSSSATLQIEANGVIGPAVTSQPTNVTVTVGQNAAFAVTTTGSAPLTYQWYFNNSNLAPQGNAATLNLTNVQLAQAGGYQVIVSNAAGAVTSSVATLTVSAVAPFITAQPTSVSVAEGQAAQFTATAGGTAPLSYQWYFNETNLLNGANSNVLLLASAQPGSVGSYLVLVTNSIGAVTSTPALLQLQGLPNYTTEPPGLTGGWQAADFALTLAPDNRTRTLFASTNLIDWEEFTNLAPSAASTIIPYVTTNVPLRFFRARVTP